jgi:hypothetical protein
MRGAVLACAYLSCYGPIEGPKFIKGDMSSKKKWEKGETEILLYFLYGIPQINPGRASGKEWAGYYLEEAYSWPFSNLLGGQKV